MNSSADIAILMGVAELAKRFGLRPSEADAGLIQRPIGDRWLEFELNFADPPPEAVEKFDRMCRLLGCGPDGTVKTKSLAQMEDIVERALSLAPRARTR